MRDAIFLTIILGFLGGVALHSFFAFSLFFICALLIASSAILFFFIFFKKYQTRSIPALVALAFLAGALGLLRFNVGSITHLEELQQNIGTVVALQGIISAEPDVREKITLLTVSIESPVRTKILLTVPKVPEYHYGDEISFIGSLEIPRAFETDAGKMFDYAAYLAKDGVYFTEFKPKVSVRASGKGNVVKAALFDIKNFFLRSIEKILPRPESDLLGGLLLGANTLGSALTDLFRMAGIVHIVVLSGYNVTLIAEAIMRLLSFLSRRIRLTIGAVAIVLFAIMTGASATIVRASLMALLVLLARATYRRYAISRALILTGFLMVLHNPKILIFDFSFQLSFLATCGLIYLSPLIERYFRFVPGKFQIREFAVSNIVTQIFVLPLLLFATGQFSIVSLPVNMLVLPFIPLTMLLGFLTGVLATVHATLALPLGYIAYLFLYAEIKAVEFFGGLPWASVSVTYFGVGLMLIAYGGLFWFISRLYLQKSSAS